MMPRPFSHLGDVPIAEFLREYWQRKPLLARRVLPEFTLPLSADELAGLALEEEVESRLVLEHGSRGPWELWNGPFSDETFAALPASHWTLLVQAVDHWVPEISALLEYFRFIPNWRLDDIMVSYAADRGGVGPHYDYYDVFLLQASGRRRWRIGQRCDPDSPRLAGTRLNILAEFHTEREWLLEPGDLLYVPPQIAHWGIAEGDDCCTCSIGFRAPSHADILAEFGQDIAAGLVERRQEHRRFQDPGGEPPHNPGELSEDAVAQVQRILREYLDQPERIASWFGRYMTQTKYPEFKPPPRRARFPRDWRRELGQARTHWRRRLSSRFAYRRTGIGHRAELFVDGENFDCPQALAAELCGKTRFCGLDFAPFLQDSEAVELLVKLLNLGSLELAEGEPCD